MIFYFDDFHIYPLSIEMDFLVWVGSLGSGRASSAGHVDLGMFLGS